MKSRRGFLAALGFGAGASLLGMPSAARAWGGCWRRIQRSKPWEENAVKETNTSTTTCPCACPINLYSQVFTTYYYYCLCCKDSTNCFAPSGFQYDLSNPPK